MPTPRTAQLAMMSDAELNARLRSRKVTDALLDQLAADAAEAERIEGAGEDLAEHDSNGNG